MAVYIQKFAKKIRRQALLILRLNMLNPVAALGDKHMIKRSLFDYHWRVCNRFPKVIRDISVGCSLETRRRY